MTEQIFNAVIVIVQGDFKKRQLIGNVEYLLHTVSQKLLFGLKTVWINNAPIRIADSSRVIIDALMDSSWVV